MCSVLHLQDAYLVPGPTKLDIEMCEASKDIPITLQIELRKALLPIALMQSLEHE